VQHSEDPAGADRCRHRPSAQPRLRHRSPAPDCRAV